MADYLDFERLRDACARALLHSFGIGVQNQCFMHGFDKDMVSPQPITIALIFIGLFKAIYMRFFPTFFAIAHALLFFRTVFRRMAF